MAVFLSPCCLANSRSCHDRLAWWVPHVPNNLSMFWSQACLQLIQLIIHQNHPIAPKHPPSDRINQLNQLINHFIQPTFTNSRISFWTDDQLRFRWQDWARAGGRARRTRRSDAGGLCGRSAVVEKVNCGKIWENRRKKAGANLVMGKKWKEFGWDSEVALKNMPQRSQYTQYTDQKMDVDYDVPESSESWGLNFKKLTG